MDSALRNLPSRPSLKAWAALEVLLIIGSYLLTLALAAACAYAPFWLIENGVSGNGQVLLLLIGGLVIAVTLLWSLVPRREQFKAPGPRLDSSSQPRLFAEVQRLATTLREPMPQEIYIIPDLNAAVTERGGVMGFGSRRVMFLGLPLLQVLTVAQFCAVVAHEFGHYYGGDTRLGPWVYKARGAMVRTIGGLGEPNAALGALARFAVVRLVHWAVIKILVAYWTLFLRITQLISRRQEFRADELACHATGSQALIEGLRGLHGAAAALPAYQTELEQVLTAGYRPAIAEGFARFIAVPPIAEAISSQLDKALKEGRTNPYDSHPPLRDRIARAQRLPTGEAPRADPPGISLIDDVASVEVQILQHLNPNRKVTELKPASWEQVGTEVWMPQWKRLAEEYAAPLKGTTVGSLQEVVKDLNKIGSQIRDPKGMLITREQRTQRAGHLVGAAFALALSEAGWELHAGPGELHLNRGADELNPFETVAQLASGALSAGSWLERSKALGIENLPLGRSPARLEASAPLPPQSSSSSSSSHP
ncbi:MAG TPA: M48 family metallopeptidase [Terriglobia bacterium]|nr:M48 family metallopeptidase [Terriglobia bacterium]